MRGIALAGAVLAIGFPAGVVAQGAATPASAAQERAMAAFTRASAAIGTPVTQASLQWPASLDVAGAMPTLFSAVHRVTLDLRADTLRRVTYQEQVRDTVSLRRRVAAVHQQLERHFAAHADRCTLPAGEPGHLWAPQRVSMLWQRGANGSSTMLTWEVAAGGTYVIAITAGRTVGDDAATWVACPR